MIIVGIDVGLTGAVAFLNDLGEFLDVIDMPVVESEKKTGSSKHRINTSALRKIIFDNTSPIDGTSLAYLEIAASHPDQGRSSIFSFGRTYGSIEGVLAAMNIPIRYVAPQTWKKHFGLKGKDKEQARRLAIEQFPMAPLSLKKDHNKAEALLLAWWACQTQAPHLK